MLMLEVINVTKHYEQRKEANKKYMQGLDDIKVRVPKGKREIYKAYAESKGTSLNKLIVDLLEKDMESN